MVTRFSLPVASDLPHSGWYKERRFFLQMERVFFRMETCFLLIEGDGASNNFGVRINERRYPKGINDFSFTGFELGIMMFDGC